MAKTGKRGSVWFLGMPIVRPAQCATACVAGPAPNQAAESLLSDEDDQEEAVPSYFCSVFVYNICDVIFLYIYVSIYLSNRGCTYRMYITLRPLKFAEAV